MSSCQGNVTATTKIDREMSEYIDAEAERLGLSRAEFLRRMFDLYRESRRENTECPHCGEIVKFDLRT
jgi:negative regulator of replication initiation